MDFEETLEKAETLIRLAAMNRGLAGRTVDAGGRSGYITELLEDGVIADIMFQAECLSITAFGKRLWSVAYQEDNSALLGLIVVPTDENKGDDLDDNETVSLLCCVGAVNSLVLEGDDDILEMRGVLEIGGYSLEPDHRGYISLPDEASLVSLEVKRICVQHAPNWSYLDPELALRGHDLGQNSTAKKFN